MGAALSYEAARPTTKPKRGAVMKTASERIDPNVPRRLGPCRSRRRVYSTSMTSLEPALQSTRWRMRPTQRKRRRFGFNRDHRSTAWPRTDRIHQALSTDLWATQMPAFLWFHGGGQVLGYAAQDDATLKRLCTEVCCIVAAREYRLAPEARSPAGAEDGYTAYRWLLEEAAKLASTSGGSESRVPVVAAASLRPPF